MELSLVKADRVGGLKSGCGEVQTVEIWHTDSQTALSQTPETKQQNYHMEV